MKRYVAVMAILAATAMYRPALGQCPGGRCQVRFTPYQQNYPVYVQQSPQAYPQATGDPAGFLAWLNQTRAAYGLCQVGYDKNLEAWAYQNNLAQAASGLGHFVFGPARRQNSAWNAGFPGVEALWMNSPGHRSALLDPSISVIGIAWYGAWCTFSAR